MDGKQIKLLLLGDHRVDVINSVDSTNEEVKRRSRSGAPGGLVVIADRQTAGKGRNGRVFFSPAGTGIYLSVLFDVREESFSDTMMLTTQAAVAVAHAVSVVCGKEAQIKWVNDVYLENKKICGILAETLTDPGSGAIRQVVVGIGINVYRPADVPPELNGIFGYIFTGEERSSGLRDRLAAAVINELSAYYEALPARDFLSEYRDRSNVIGKQIRYGLPEPDGKEGEDWLTGTAIAVDDTGGLVVERPDGITEVLHTGEISVRLMRGEQ